MVHPYNAGLYSEIGKSATKLQRDNKECKDRLLHVKRQSEKSTYCMNPTNAYDIMENSKVWKH